MHLRLFETARDALNKAGFNVKIGLMSPAPDTYAKKGLLSSTHRIPMCELALKSSSWIKCVDWETKQIEWTRTSDVLDHYHRELSKDYPGQLT